MIHWLPDNGIVETQEDMAMKASKISFYEWQERYKTEATCLRQLAQLRWPNGL
jgi:hypothetical protein